MAIIILMRVSASHNGVTPPKFGRPAAKLAAEQPQTPNDTMELSDVSPEDAKFLDHHLRQILNHATSQVSSELTSLPAAQLMFHGTAADFDAVEARPNRRVRADGSIKWKGTAIFAAMDPRVGLHYTAQRGKGVTAGINLVDYTSPSEPISYGLYGGDSLEDAMDKAYGKPGKSQGYIHLLDKSEFVREPGLGKMEMVSRDESANLGRVDLDVRSAIDSLVESGAVTIHWSPK